LKIVFVHLNSKIPKYLKKNIESCLLNFPDVNTVLIHNEVHINIKVKGLELYRYVPDQQWEKLEKDLQHPKDFRDNFWLTSLARFFAITNFMQTHAESVLHVESDNFLSVDFPVERFEDLYQDYAFPIVSKDRAIASILYFKNARASKTLADFASDLAQENNWTSDMLVLRKFYDANSMNIQVLPTGLSQQTKFSNPVDPTVLASMNKGLDILGGVFDGSDIGVRFFGTDPRNRRGFSTIGAPVPENYSDGASWNLTMNKNRRFIDLEIEGARTAKVFSVHATCKEVRLFKKNTQVRALIRYLKYIKKGKFKKFYPKIFVIALAKHLFRKFNS
jgi:hypothetical protein